MLIWCQRRDELLDVRDKIFAVDTEHGLGIVSRHMAELQRHDTCHQVTSSADDNTSGMANTDAPLQGKKAGDNRFDVWGVFWGSGTGQGMGS